MVLTDLDGIQFELDVKMLKEMHRLKKDMAECTEIRTIMNDYLLVKETPAEIWALIKKECMK